MRWLLLIIIGLLPFCSFAEVHVEPSRLLIDQRMEIMAGSYAYFEVPSSAGTTLVAKFKVSGGLENSMYVWLLDLHNYQLFQASRQFSFYKGTSGTVQDVAEYKFTIPATGLYYLVFDNRHALMLPRTAYANVYVIERTLGPQYQKDVERYNGLYNGLLRKLFEFDDFDVAVRLCSIENSFSNTANFNITMCRELIDGNDKRGLPAANVFVFFHEAAHSLLNLWEYPGYDNEDIADEMATVLSLLLKKEELALQAAQWWANSGSQQEALDKMIIDDRHTISPQRARNIVNWLNRKDELLKRWQTIWVPHMTREALIALRDSSDSWVDKQLVLATLATRDEAAVTATSTSDSHEGSVEASPVAAILAGKWRDVLGVLPLVYDFQENGTWTAQLEGYPILGRASGAWNIAGDRFTGSVDESSILVLPKGRQWIDEIEKLTEEEFVIRNQRGIEEKYKRVK